MTYLNDVFYNRWFYSILVQQNERLMKPFLSNSTDKISPLLLWCLMLFLSTKSFANKSSRITFEDSVVINNMLSMKILCAYSHNIELEDGVRKANSKLIYMAVLTESSQSTPISLSRYPISEARTIQQVFKDNETYRPPNSDSYYKILEHGEKKVMDKILRYKITEITFEEGTKTNSILYYFMKGDSATEFYELKVVCDPKMLSTFKDLTEQIALSVYFL